uniref:G-protein coupled receptors family 1 profile domain-containing protein n=1 Tax=Caenorhabditis japonica TaxID=281687 RepID=A0A8R1DU48_CAEJA
MHYGIELARNRTTRNRAQGLTMYNQILIRVALIFLSVCDCLQLFFSFLVLFLPALHDFSQSTPYSTLGQLAYLSTGLLSPLLLAFNCASIWTICFISIQRHRAILRPLSSISSPSKPFKPLLFISFMALLFNACKWAEFRWFWSHDPTNSSDYQYILAHEPSDLARNEHYHRVERRSVTLLISIVTMFFLCHTGGLAYRFVDQEKYNNSELFVLLKDIINLLFNVYSFTNPLLYFVFTRQFRDLRTMWHSHFGSPASRSESYAVTNTKPSTKQRHLSMPSIYRSPCVSGKLLP